MKKKIYLIIALFLFALVSGCSNSSSSTMTKLDREFNQYALDAAEELLKKEANSLSTVNVETGELEYQYTLHNETQDLYEVYYLAKYDADNVIEDEWIEICVTITGKTKSVKDVDCCYWDVDDYESSYGMPCSAVLTGGELWYNVNSSAEEIKQLKEEWSTTLELD